MRDLRRIGFAVFLLVLVALYFVLRVGLGFGQLAPDLLVVALLLAARELRAGSAAGLGLLLGVLDGAVTPLRFGYAALVLTLLGFLGARSREVIAGDSAVFLGLYLFLGKWLFDVLLAVFTGAAFRGAATDLLLVSPLAALYAAAAGLVAVAFYRTLS